MTEATQDRSALDALIDDFMERLRRGERPTVDEYATRYPALGAEIRDLFPALDVLEGLGSVAGDAVPAGPAPPQHLGDYLILREVGRGGMGVVYEAVQQSLGRHVALKVLSPGLHTRPSHFERFRREARAAAGLHHTNIVPVFGVGEQDGTHFYAMQFIRGQTLAAVLGELRERPTVVDGPTAEEPSTLASASLTSDAQYYRNVALLAAQAADALHYAHRQGIIHRDIKPSNLLLDTAGILWVTDFGLAKASDGEPLTETGDVLGTLAYMAPEQLEGRADARTDVYGIGVTLYELAARFPAFRDDVRIRLIEKVRRGDPPAPRSIDPRVPRDLDTIVRKAMAAAPTGRYKSAAEFADDLRRFADGRTIRARRAGLAGQAWRWARRNPAVASLLGIVFLCLTAIAIVSTSATIRARERAGEISGLNDQLRDRLWHTYLNQAHADRWSNRSGRRFDGLAALADAAAIRPDPELRDEAVACLSLTDVAEERAWDATGYTKLPDAIDFTPDLEHFARPHGYGVSVRRAVDDVEVARLERGERIPIACRFSPTGRLLAVRFEQRGPALEVWDWRAGRTVFKGDPRIEHMAFDVSPDDKRLAFADGQMIRLIEFDTEKVVDLGTVSGTPFRVRFDLSGQRVAVTSRRGTDVYVFNTSKSVGAIRLKHAADNFGLDWDATGRTLAVGSGYDVFLWDPDRPAEPIAVLRNQGQLSHDVLLHPSGRLVVTHAMDGLTRVWDATSGRVAFRLDRHANRFSPDGKRLSFRGDRRIGLWRVSAGDEAVLMTAPDLSVPDAAASDFLVDDGLIVTGGRDALYFWDVARRVLVGKVPAPGPVYAVRYDPVGRFIYASRNEGVFRWPTKREGARLLVGPAERVTLIPPRDPKRDGTGPEPIFRNPHDIAIDSAGLRMIVSYPGTDYAVLNDFAGPTRRLIFHDRVRCVDISRDGRWAACGRSNDVGFGLWDASTGELAHTFYRSGSGPVAFSPDNETLVTCESGELCGWSVRTREQLWMVPRAETVGPMAVAFSPDGSVLAYTHDRAEVRLLDMATRTVLARLVPTPAPETVVGLRFNREGDSLVVLSGRAGARLWDLRAIRAKLTELGLDWPGAAYPANREMGRLEVVAVER